MPEKRRTRTTGGQVRAQQTTLRDHFQRTYSGIVPIAEQHELHAEHIAPVTPSLQPADPCSPSRPVRPSKPTQLFSIFTKVSSVRGRPRDDVEVTDITDVSSDIELSTEPPLSFAHQPFTHSESSRATSHSPPPNSAQLDVHYCSDASSPRAVARHHKHLDKTREKESNNQTLCSGDIVPLPSSCSQHVRGVQHSYTACQAPLRRSMFPALGQSNEGTLDFLAKWQKLDDVPLTPPDRIHTSLTLQQCEEHLQSISRDYTETHPAFAQIPIHREGPSSLHAEMWTRRFRPRRANEVLGNERRALYLRDWLRALELHLRDRENSGKSNSTLRKRVEPRGVKRRRIVRAVTRKRNKKRRVDSDDDLDDFVVFSDAGEEQTGEPPEDSEDELAFCQRTLARLHRRDTTADTRDAHLIASNDLDTEIERATSRSLELVQTDFAGNLTNTLLISGPPGCGKTAAVYACAEELGWDVFEMYPGIGRRNGASLDHFVGDVGRNHIVQTTYRRAPAKTTRLEVKERMGLRGYLAEKQTGEFAGFGKGQEAGSEGRPISVEGDSPTCELQLLPPDQEESSDEATKPGKYHAESDGSRPIVRQSLVLLEEVDILFKEDAGFWPAVVDFIRGCQRPVVMTCNDPGLVPVVDLPLQNVLAFEPCPSSVAATFLQCVSLAEGCLVPHEDLMVLYESTHPIDGLDVPDAAVYPRAEPVPLRDLRRSITQLQMLCAGARHGSASEMHQGDEAKGHAGRSVRPLTISAVTKGSTVDSEWWREMNRHSEVMSHVDAELRRQATGRGEVVVVDEEEGYVMLEEREGVVSCERDGLIAEEAVRHSRGAHEGSDTGPNEASIDPAARGVFRARVEYRSRMEGALEGVLAPPAPMMPQRSVFVDYIPWVRHMVLVDDELERRATEGRGRGRCTRNSMRGVHARAVVVRDGPRDVLRRSRLGGGAFWDM